MFLEDDKGPSPTSRISFKIPKNFRKFPINLSPEQSPRMIIIDKKSPESSQTTFKFMGTAQVIPASKTAYARSPQKSEVDLTAIKPSSGILNKMTNNSR